MKKFVKYMSGSFLNGQNIALYSDKSGYFLSAEIDGKSKGKINFESEAAAQKWYDSIPGSGVGRLDNALTRIVEV